MTLLRGVTAEQLKEQRIPLDVLRKAQAQQDTISKAPLPVGDSTVAKRLAPIAKAFVNERAYHGHPFAFVVLHKGGVVAE